jgi:hypothetical protein
MMSILGRFYFTRASQFSTSRVHHIDDEKVKGLSREERERILLEEIKKWKKEAQGYLF